MKISKPYTRPDGRKHVIITRDDGTKTTRSYPRYLLEEKLGRPLLDDETVDHIDGDFTNDSPENLRSLSRSENSAWAWKTGNSKPTPMRDDLKKMHRARINGVKNPLAKFTETQVSELRLRQKYHGCVGDWANEFMVSKRTMQNLLSGISYKQHNTD